MRCSRILLQNFIEIHDVLMKHSILCMILIHNYDTKKIFIRFLTYTAMFIDKFNNVLSPICKDNKHCYVMGDLNPDLLQYNHHVPTVTFKGY